MIIIIKKKRKKEESRISRLTLVGRSKKTQ